jgi:hypothetical protein
VFLQTLPLKLLARALAGKILKSYLKYASRLRAGNWRQSDEYVDEGDNVIHPVIVSIIDLSFFLDAKNWV